MAKENKTRKPFRLSYAGRSLSFTPLGTRYVIVCLLVGLAAVNSGSNLLYLVVSMMLSMMIVSGVLSEHSLRKLAAARRLPEEIYAATPFTLRFSVKNNKKRLTSFALTVSDYYEGGGRGRPAFLPKLSPGETAAASAETVVPSRGEWITSGVEVGTRFPFGLFEKSLRAPKREVRTVFPHVRQLGHEALDSISSSLGDAPSLRKGHGAEIISLREYGPEDEARLIHWKSSARLATLMAKEFEAEQRLSVTVILDNLAPKGADEGYPARFEEAVVLAASVINHIMFHVEQRPVSLITRDFAVEAGIGRTHFLRLMGALARIKPVPETASDEAVLRALSEGPCVLVLAGRGPGPGIGWERYRAQASVVMEAEA